jgi:hypothetical protein
MEGGGARGWVREEAALGVGRGLRSVVGLGEEISRRAHFTQISRRAHFTQILVAPSGLDSCAKSAIRGAALELTSQPFNSLRSNSSHLISLPSPRSSAQIDGFSRSAGTWALRRPNSNEHGAHMLCSDFFPYVCTLQCI